MKAASNGGLLLLRFVHMGKTSECEIRKDLHAEGARGLQAREKRHK
jgi:hypothetical protein